MIPTELVESRLATDGHCVFSSPLGVTCTLPPPLSATDFHQTVTPVVVDVAAGSFVQENISLHTPRAYSTIWNTDHMKIMEQLITKNTISLLFE